VPPAGVPVVRCNHATRPPAPHSHGDRTEIAHSAAPPASSPHRVDENRTPGGATPPPLRHAAPNGIIRAAGAPTLLPNGRIRIVYLRTLGHPALENDDGVPVHLRTKDLALLIYLCVHGPVGHSRGRLAALLWGDSRESAARHSLTQALGRMGRLLPGALALKGQEVRWTGALPCDAVALLRGAVSLGEVDEGFTLYRGPFLEGFEAGKGAEDFGDWVHHRRDEVRNAALKLLEHAGEAAAAREEWTRMLRLGERAVFVDPGAEAGRRLVMRALAGSGERNQALRYYDAFVEWLREEYGSDPDPDTRALAEQLRAQPADPPQPPAVRRPAPPPSSPKPLPAPVAGDPPAAAAADPPDVPRVPAHGTAPDLADGSRADGGDPPRHPSLDPPAGGGNEVAPADPAPSRARRWLRRPGVWIPGALALVILLGLGVWASDRPPPPPETIRHGETLRQRGDGAVYLAFDETLYAYPDTATLHACTGVRPPPVREVRALPAWPRRRLPSARRHTWMGDTLPIKSSDPAELTAYVTVGCILSGIPDPATLDSIFGPGALKRLVRVPPAAIPALPLDVKASGYPVRLAGTLIRSPSGLIRWITYHGGALAVADSAVLATHCRTPREAVDVDEAEFRYYHPFALLHPATEPCRRRG
jgi:DNA-binding SARP family transcriptional activator